MGSLAVPPWLGRVGGCIWTQAEVPSLTVDLLFGSKCHDTCVLGKLAAITVVVVCIGWNQAPQQPLCPQDPLDVTGRCWPRGEVSSGHRVNSEAEGPIKGSCSPCHGSSALPSPGPQQGSRRGCQPPGGQGQGQLATASA